MATSTPTATSTTIQALAHIGESLGLRGADLHAFIKDQQDKEREEREKAREERVSQRDHDDRNRAKEKEERELQREREDRDHERQKEERIRQDKEKTKELEFKQWEIEQRQKEQEMHIKQLELQLEMKKIEIQAGLEEDSSKSQGDGAVDLDEGQQEVQPGVDAHRFAYIPDARLKGPKMSPFSEKDEMDAYLYRFERCAELQRWPRDAWATYLAGLLTGKALDVYARLTPDQSRDYETLKSALLKRYAMTSDGYRKKFYECRPEPGESPPQFIVRLENYFMRWVDLEKIERSFDGLRTLLIRERFLTTCTKALEIFLKERAIKDLDELGKLAEQHEDAHRTSFIASQGNKPISPHRSPRRHHKAFNKTGQSKVKCFICSKPGHVARNCFQRNAQVNAMTSQPAEFEPTLTEGQLEATQAMDFKHPRQRQGQNFGQRPTGQPFQQNSVPYRMPPDDFIQSQQSTTAGQGHPRHPPFSSHTEGQQLRCRLHNRVACTECNYRVTVNQHSCGAMLEPEAMLSCGCVVPFIAEACSLGRTHNAKMPIAEGHLFDQKVRVLRDTGCSTVVVRRSLVPDDCLTGEKVLCGLIDGTLRQNPVAKITVDTPYLKGEVKATCMLNPMYDLIVGNVPEVEDLVWSCKDQPGRAPEAAPELLQDTSKFVDGTVEQGHAVITRSQAKADHKVKPLKVSQSTLEDVTPEDLSRLQREDETLQSWFEKAKSKVTEGEGQETRFELKNGLLWRVREDQRRRVKQLAIPQTLREKVMSLGHDSIMSGHQGVKKTYDRVTAEFFWPGVHADVQRYCRSCDICQRTTPKGRVSKMPLGQMPLIDRPFKRVAVDLVGPIAPMTDRGNRYILTMVDYATRYPEATALKSVEAETVAEALVTMFTRVGIPEEILSDQGTQFMSSVMKEVGRLLSMTQLRTSVYHPMCNGLVERFNGTLKAMLRRMCAEKPKDWDRYLAALLFAYREVPQESLCFSPFELLYGRTVRGPMSILREMWTKQNSDPDVKLTYQYVLELRDRLQETCELAKQELSKAQGRQKKYYDIRSKERVFKPGDQVLILLPTDANKLLMHWKGPFEVLERKNGHDYMIQLPDRIKLFHANMLKKYHARLTETEPEIQQIGAVVVEEQQGIENSQSEITEFQSEQKETFRDVNINPELPDDRKQEIQRLLTEFSDIFTDVPKVTAIGEHSIELTSSEPVRTRPYPLPFALRGEVNKEIESMLENKIIEPSTASYLSPIVVVKKSDGSNRLCVDYRKLNKVTFFDPEPMPQMQEIFSSLTGSQYFSKFDFCKGYWQVPMREIDKDLTTFAGPEGLYRFRVMPFGLVNAPATFSRIMRKLLRGLRNLKNYLDDVLSHTAVWTEHPTILRQFFQRVREANLSLKPSKCFIGYTSLVFLGHKLGQDTLAPNDDLVQKIRDAPSPTNKKQLRSFLGLVGYYRAFVPNFAAIAAPLTDLTKKGSPDKLVWTEIHEQAFQALKGHVCTHPVLCLPDVNKPFILQTDASADGIGAILLQEVNGVKHPVAFASKRLLPRERNFSTIEREALAIVWGVQKFQNYLMGVHFTLETDHHPLQYLDTAKFQNSRIMRWSLLLQPYRFTVRAIKGSDNVGADFLSRYV